ncbi:unnamed protein product [Vitrella brassicaformis CCMP3155]|uniref:Hint domain-containing protein n=2 Tax=Vitrella brassicaformis TaxID=1169539 RepID=A0A0G4FBM5_VITBC|nr:unnamed protein product [Vitrella brassicaformis CCMP3155]|eukprot:CEM10019.1 unnamed protein product [Vitrella brassicaformis CCMP3155]
MANPMARLHGERSGKHYQCLWGTWVGQPDEPLNCAQSFSQKTCIDPNATIWRVPTHNETPRPLVRLSNTGDPLSSFQSLSSRLHHSFQHRGGNTEAHFFRRSSLGEVSRVMSLFLVIGRLIDLLLGVGIMAKRPDKEALKAEKRATKPFQPLEAVAASEVRVGDRILSYDGNAGGQPRLTEVYFRESYPMRPTRVIDIEATRTEDAPPPCSSSSASVSLRLSPSHRLPVVRRGRGRHVVSADQVMPGDWIETVGPPSRHSGGEPDAAQEMPSRCWHRRGGGDSAAGRSNVTEAAVSPAAPPNASISWPSGPARVTGARRSTQLSGLELIYTLDSHLVANGMVITDSDEPLDAHMPYTLLSNLDTRIVYWLWGAAGVNSRVFRAYWRWSVAWSDAFQAVFS